MRHGLQKLIITGVQSLAGHDDAQKLGDGLRAALDLANMKRGP